MTDLDESQATATTDSADGGSPRADVSRRVMLRGATVGGLALPLLAACGGGDDDPAADSGAAEESSSADDPSSSAPPDDGGGAGGLTVPAADVPVGGGTILKGDKVVVTQPTSGQFKAFSAVCTHMGCTVGKVEDGEIVCPCHGSHFSIEDGSPVAGPAKKPLEGKTATADGDQVSIT